MKTLKTLTRDETEHGVEYYLASEVDALLASIGAQPATEIQAKYSLDDDPMGIRARVVHTVLGALTLGAQGANKPPEGHWLGPVWDLARAQEPADKPDNVNVLINGEKYEVPMPVACEMLRLTLLLLQPVQPVQWSVTFNSNHCGNYFGSEEEAKECLNRLNLKHPNDVREVVPLVPAPQTAQPAVPLKKPIAPWYESARVSDYNKGWNECIDAMMAGRGVPGGLMDEWIRQTQEEAASMSAKNMTPFDCIKWLVRKTEAAHGITDPLADGGKAMGETS